MSMTCQELAVAIGQLQPKATPREVARLCLLLANHVDDMGSLTAEDKLTQAWREIGIRLQAITDQHAAMTEELETLSTVDPDKFSAQQIWILLRAIKVQSQVLQMYVGQPPASTATPTT